MFAALRRPNRPRRGVTLVEMLVVVALVVLMMVILVQIFQAATGAMSASRTTQELDVVLRSIDSMIRSDLGGVTAQMTPPNDPDRKTGYFEYMENAPADLQGEDSDDILAFTTKAPEGQVFSGRQWLAQLNSAGVQTINQKIQPVTITSQTAEVIYFLRNGNLYRRVLLVAPERQKSVVNLASFVPPMFGGSVTASWQGMNDLSARPGGFTPTAGGGGAALPPILNDLGDLTNRENRFCRPRFMNDFDKDGIPDDGNGDGIFDYYPTLYTDGTNGWNGQPNGRINENGIPTRLGPASYDFFAFPFIYPGMYSVPNPTGLANGLGWLHYMPPNATTGYINHSPLDLGETPNFAPGGNQTWWGFPTWRETMTGQNAGVVGWNDPVVFIGQSTTQPLGLSPFSPKAAPSLASTTFLPPVYQPRTSVSPPYFDGAGSASFVSFPVAAGSKQSAPQNPVWEDDLILTGVRSFDVKAYDPYAPLYNLTSGTAFTPSYQDLGYGGLDYTATAGAAGEAATPPTFNTSYASTSTVWGPNGKAGASGTNQVGVAWQGINSEPVGFGHEGRIPPLLGDFRLNPRRPFLTNLNNGALFANNVGDSGAGVIRLTHTFDTWSTDYTNAPDIDVFYDQNPGVAFPPPASPPPAIILSSTTAYPSFPPPYPSACLRGIQIQIRVVDSRNERPKVLTIRHDFTDKLTN